MSNAPVCHIPVDQTIVEQPRAARFVPIPLAVDLKSALAAINALRLIVQQLSGQIPPPGPRGLAGLPGTAGSGGVAGAAGSQGTPGTPGPKGKDGKTPKDGEWVEDRSQRVTEKKRIFQDNDETSENYVDFKRINKVVWTNQITGAQFVWTRGDDD